MQELLSLIRKTNHLDIHVHVFKIKTIIVTSTQIFKRKFHKTFFKNWTLTTSILRGSLSSLMRSSVVLRNIHHIKGGTLEVIRHIIEISSKLPHKEGIAWDTKLELDKPAVHAHCHIPVNVLHICQ